MDPVPTIDTLVPSRLKVRWQRCASLQLGGNCLLPSEIAIHLHERQLPVVGIVLRYPIVDSRSEAQLQELHVRTVKPVKA